MTDGDAAGSRVSVRLVTHPHSVRTARQLTADTLRDWDLPTLVDDASLIVTELCTNATLHSGASYFVVEVSATSPDSVRIAVGDDGDVPAAAVLLRHDRSTSAGVAAATTTGRGLAIVQELSCDWGVTVEEGGKCVWAHLSTAGQGRHDIDLRDRPARPDAGLPAQAPALPPGWHVVRLERCPVQLGLAQDDHLDDLVRELQLVVPRTAQPELASVIRRLLDGQAQARHMGRRTAQAAAEAGLEHVTVEMLLPSVAAEQVEQLDDAVAAADALCEAERLLTLASTPDVRRIRRWMREEISQQISRGRAPCGFDDWLASRSDADLAAGRGGARPRRAPQN